MTPAPQPRKNILMIIPDQWRYDQLGMDPSLTPNFHALMRDGVAFENHYGQMVPCAPSRASINAMARPMPREAPVTSAIFPDSTPIFSALPPEAKAGAVWPALQDR